MRLTTDLSKPLRARVPAGTRVVVIALYGDIHALEERFQIDFTIRTEKENDGRHGVWFNRGAIASHEFATKFKNAELTEEMYDKVDANNVIVEPETVWLSRGLEEA